MTVIIKIMKEKEKVIMTSPTVFRPLSLTHLHGDWIFFLHSDSAFWLPHGCFNHIVYGKPSVVWLCDRPMAGLI